MLFAAERFMLRLVVESECCILAAPLAPLPDERADEEHEDWRPLLFIEELNRPTALLLAAKGPAPDAELFLKLNEELTAAAESMLTAEDEDEADVYLLLLFDDDDDDELVEGPVDVVVDVILL